MTISWFRMFKNMQKKARTINRRVTAQKRKLNLAEYKQQAEEIIHERLKHFNEFYNFTYGSVRIRSQATRWGSCSMKGNLNFNCNIVKLPSHLIDYIVVHELCHLAQFNHSKNFWELVSQKIPRYAEYRKELHAIKL